MQIVVTELRTYPVKGFRGVSSPVAEVTLCGFANDRRWMVVDANGKFITQRNINTMALITATVLGADLLLATDGAPDLAVAAAALLPEVTVNVWGHQVQAVDCGDGAADWLQARLGRPCRLVYMADPKARAVDPAYGGLPGDHVGFADGLPILLTSMASLADLNGRMTEDISMHRFRPNIVVDGELPWAEDDWQEITIGGRRFRANGSCPRCAVSTIDQMTGVRSPDNEPIRALGGFRRDATGQVLFGRYLTPLDCGSIRVGDALSVG